MRQQYMKPQYKNNNLFSKKVTICAFLLIALCILKITPDDVFTKTKSAVKLIISHHTDIVKEIKKVKDFFTNDDEISAMNPVKEFINPVKDGSIIKGFGVQDASVSAFHYGVDIKADPSQNICSCAEGTVTEIATNEEYGSFIVIKHSDEISTLYAHLGEILPDVGSKVESGQAIARANTDDDIIHFEIKKGDTYLNPEEFIDFSIGD